MDIRGEQKILALIAHLSYLLVVGFIFGPLLIFHLKKEDPFVYDHARQALVAHLTVLVLTVVAISMLSFLIIGLLSLPFLFILWLFLIITSITAAVNVVDGKLYRYPLIQRLVNKIE